MTTPTRTRVRLPKRPVFDGRKWIELDGNEQCAVLDWIVDLCLVHGSQKSTAYQVAATFAKGLD